MLEKINSPEDVKKLKKDLAATEFYDKIKLLTDADVV